MKDERPTVKTHGSWVATVIFCAALSHNLPSAWIHSPFDRTGSLAFAIWISWMPRVLANAPKGQWKTFRGSDSLCASAILLSLASRLLELNAPAYIGLALAFSSIIPASKARWLWIVASCSWMPASGWAASQLDISSSVVGAARVCIALAGSIALPRQKLHHEIPN